MAPSDTEPFPPLLPSLDTTNTNAARPQPRRRKSSRLGGEPRGDTGGAALATLDSQSTPDSATSPYATIKGTRVSKRRKARTLLGRYGRFSVRHTWFNPLLIMLAVVAAYLRDPTPSNPVSKALFVSYPLAHDDPIAQKDPHGRQQYGKGAADFIFVAFYIVFFTFTREFTMQRILRPIAIWLGIRNKAKQARFLEQAYTAVYFGIMGPIGFWVMSRTPIWYFNTRGMFEGFPHRSHDWAVKSYYLLSASYWAQQAIVLMLMLEKPRKDFKELVLHHIVTIALIWCSYRFHFVYMGVAVYLTHDVSDFFLATSKILNYLDSPITIPYFVLFIGVWGYMRHYLNLRVLWATATEFRTVGPFDLNWETQQYKCWISQYITFSLLAILQAVNMFWMFLILRILWRYVAKGIASDEREDDEADDWEDDDEHAPNQVPQVLLNGAPAPGHETKKAR